jgi:hypothetical protein
MIETTEKYNKLWEIYTNKDITASREELLEVLGKDLGNQYPEWIKRKIREELRNLSIQIQSKSHIHWINKGMIEKTPHTLDRLRDNRLGESIKYPNRLMFVLSNPNHYIKINQDYLTDKKEQVWAKGKPRNKGAVEDNLMETFFENYFVLDPGAITDDMIKYLLDNNSLESYMADPWLKAIKAKFSKQYLLQYKLNSTSKPKETSRIMFFRWTPAIGVFRSADSHPIVENPTKHEKRSIQKGMDMYITNSSYDVITQQYQAIENITDKKWGTNHFVTTLIEQLDKMRESNTSLDAVQLAPIQEVVHALEHKTNPIDMMTKLYHLSQIPHFNNKIVQGNLLEAAIRRLWKREENLGMYLYYMIPQLQALEDIHQANQENIKTLHRDTLVCAEGSRSRNFAKNTAQSLEQFNKNKVNDRLTRGLNQHSIKQKDHLIGLFYTMHKQIQTLLKMPKGEEKNRIARTIVYNHRMIMAAEQLKQDIQLKKVRWKDITHAYFQETLSDMYDHCDSETIQEYYDAIKSVDYYIKKSQPKKAVEILSTFKSALDPISPNKLT